MRHTVGMTLEADTMAQLRLLTVSEAAQWAGVSRFTVRGWIVSGLLPSRLLDRRHRIRLADLEAAQAEAHLGSVLPAWRDDRRHAGRRLRALREARGCSQIELSSMSGVTHETISRLETGREAPSAVTVHKLARSLGVPPERFVAHDPLGLTMWTAAETATYLGVPAGRVVQWLHDGLLAGTKVSGRWLVPAVVVVELERSERLRGPSRRLDPRFRG